MLLRTIFFSLIMLCAMLGTAYADNVFFDEEFWKNANIERIQKAISNGSDIKIKTADGSTPLMFAAKYNGDIKVLQTLIQDYNQDINAVNANGDSALSLLSTTKPSLEALQFLLENGAQNNTEQIIVAYNNAVNHGASDAVIDVLLAKSGSNDSDDDPSSIANASDPILVPAPKSTQIFGDANTNPFLSHEFWKNATAKHVEELLAKGHDINTRDAKGNSALILASSLNKDAEVIKTLLSKGAKVHDKDKQDWNALMHAAASNGHPEVIEALLNHGADVNARDKAEWTPLMAAITLNPNQGIIDTLLDRGAQVNAKEIEGKTALMLGTVNNKNAENINKLLNNGADLTPKDKNNKSALDYAKENTELSKTGIIHRLQ